MVALGSLLAVPIDRVPREEHFGADPYAVPVPPRPPSHVARSRSTRGPWLIAGAGAALLLIGGAGVGTWGMMGDGFMSHTVTQHQKYRQPVETLNFNGGSSGVVISGGAAAGTGRSAPVRPRRAADAA